MPEEKTIKPWVNINFRQVAEAFQNLSYVGELRQRWEEIKKLRLNYSL